MMSNGDLLQKYGFHNWHLWTEQQEEFPKKSGVYIFRLDRQFERLKGSTDILYVGKSDGDKGLHGRLKFFIKPGPTQETSIRINRFLNMPEYSKVEIALSIHAKDEVRMIEAEILREFEEFHHELPPWNRQG